MYKLLLVIALSLLCSTTNAASLDKYADALDWQNKWQKVVSRQTDKYVQNVKRDELSQLSVEKQKQVADRLAYLINKSLSWEKVGNRFTRNFVDSCGTDLLDEFVGVSRGRKASAEERKRISTAYKTCGTSSIEKSMTMIYNALGDLSGTAGERFNKAVGGIIIKRKSALRSFREKYLDAKGHKAFAQSDSGNWNWRSNRTSKEHAINNALASCRGRNQDFKNWQPCKIIHLDEKWTDVYHRLYTRVATSESDIMSNKALNAYQHKYKDVTRDKAFAQSVNGAWSWRSSKKSVSDAIEKALSSCRQNNKEHEALFPCKIINVNNSWRGD